MESCLTSDGRPAAESEEGFVLVAALLIMLVLTIIGIAGSRNTSMELLIAGNDRSYKDSFYQADGGVEIGAETLEQCLACISGFPADGTLAAPWTDGFVIGDQSTPSKTIYVTPGDSLNFWKNFAPTSIPGDDNAHRDLVVPWGYTGSAPHTNINVAGDTKLTTGAAINAAAGYEGKGKGIGAGGAYLVYDIISKHLGKNNSEAVISLLYRHIIGQEGSCYYP